MTINKGSINSIVVSVTEQTTLSAPVNYLFEFSRKAGGVKYYCIAQITTNYGTRQLFSIEDKTSPDATQGEVELQVGEYTYKIYQQASSTNLDPSNTTVAASGFAYVQTGICQVYESQEPSVQYEGANLTNPVYEK